MKLRKILLFLLVIAFSFTALACKEKVVEETPIVSDPTVSLPEETPIPSGHIAIQIVNNVDSVEDRLIVQIGTTLENYEVPSISNQVFVGFYQDALFENEFDLTEPLMVNTTVYLRYASTSNPSIVSLDVEFLTKEWNNRELSGYFIQLPSSGRFGSRITWTSQNNSLMTSRGYLIPPSIRDGVQEVSMRARVERGTSSETIFLTMAIMPHVPLQTVTSTKDMPFENLTSEYEVENGEIRAYFLNDTVIPYVDLIDFLRTLNGLVEFDEIEFVQEGNTLLITLISEDTETNELGEEIITTEEYTAIIDFENGIMTVPMIGFFSGYIKSTQTDYSEGLTYLDTYYEEAETVTFDFVKYRIDILLYEEDGQTKFLLPFHLANTLFIGSTYYNVYYNGDGFYGIYGVPSSSTTATAESQLAYNTIRTSSFNNTVIHDEVSLQTYHMLAFIMDYYYGLKKDKGIEDFHVVLDRYANNLVSGNTRRTSEAIFEFLNKTLDDLHTSHRFVGMYEPSAFNIALTSITQVGNNVRDWYYILWDVQDIIAAKYGSGQNPPDYRFIDEGKTAVIYLDGFYTATVDDPDGDDSNRFMREVMDAILLENPLVENIIVDLSYNTGGNLGALLRVLGYLTELPIEMHYQNPTDGSRVTYFTEVATEAYEEINWFILTSRVTFSAANLMTSIAKQQGFATIIGTTSGGGASSITPQILPNGTFFTMSSLNVLSYRVQTEDGWEYFSIEYGIEPDYIVDVDDIHNDDVLAAIVNQANADKAN